MSNANANAIAIVKSATPAEIAVMCKNLLSECGYEIGEYNPHRVSAWLINAEGVEFIAVGSHEQEALDNCVNENMWDRFLAESFDHDDIIDADENEFYTLGNAGESFWITSLMIKKILQA